MCRQFENMTTTTNTNKSMKQHAPSGVIQGDKAKDTGKYMLMFLTA